MPTTYATFLLLAANIITSLVTPEFAHILLLSSSFLISSAELHVPNINYSSGTVLGIDLLRYSKLFSER